VRLPSVRSCPSSSSSSSSRPRVLLLNGPNLNLLGTREPETYGAHTLADVEASARALGAELGCDVECFQSNHEGAILDRVHAFRPGGSDDGDDEDDKQRHRFIVVNPGALTHTSVALRDALTGIGGVPFYEVHISNVHAREEFRHTSRLSDKAAGVVVGLGVHGYEMCLRAGMARHAAAAGKC